MKKNRFKIKEFSLLCQVTVKTLRHYEKIGLLKPNEVDAWTGYRYYDVAQMQTLLNIRRLKSMGFSLDEILELYADGNISQKTEDLVGPYELHDFFLYHYLRFGYRPHKLFIMAKAAFNGEHLRRRHHKTLAPHLLPPLLRPAVQTFLSARRSKGWKRKSQSPWRLAHAVRCLQCPMARRD